MAAPALSCTKTDRAIREFLSRVPRWVFGVGALLHAAIIFGLSSRSGSGVPIGGFVMNLCHAPAFGVLALWVALAFGVARAPERMNRGAIFGVLSSLLYGVIDEWHQSMVPGRHQDPIDVLIDIAGAGVAMWILSIWIHRKSLTMRRCFVILLGVAAIMTLAYAGS